MPTSALGAGPSPGGRAGRRRRRRRRAAPVGRGTAVAARRPGRSPLALGAGAVRLVAAAVRVPAAARAAARRRRPPAGRALAELVAVDRASVWRAPALRRGAVVLALLPGLLAAGAQLPWSSLVVLPGLVAAAAGLLFGVNAFCLDGPGAVWLASLPHPPAPRRPRQVPRARRDRARRRASSRRSPAPRAAPARPTSAELAAVAASVVASTRRRRRRRPAHVAALALPRRPHRPPRRGRPAGRARAGQPAPRRAGHPDRAGAEHRRRTPAAGSLPLLAGAVVDRRWPACRSGGRCAAGTTRPCGRGSSRPWRAAEAGSPCPASRPRSRAASTSQRHSRSTHSRPAAPIARARSGSASRPATASATSATRVPSTTLPGHAVEHRVRRPARSGPPPPAARSPTPRGTRCRAPRPRARRSGCGTASRTRRPRRSGPAAPPTARCRSARRRRRRPCSAASRRSRGASGPPPTSSSAAPGTRARTAGSAAMSTSWPLRGTSRLTQTTTGRSPSPCRRRTCSPPAPGPEHLRVDPARQPARASPAGPSAPAEPGAGVRAQVGHDVDLPADPAQHLPRARQRRPADLVAVRRRDRAGQAERPGEQRRAGPPRRTTPGRSPPPRRPARARRSTSGTGSMSVPGWRTTGNGCAASYAGAPRQAGAYTTTSPSGWRRASAAT